MENIIYGLSNEEYHHSPPYNEYLSSSQLKWYLKSPRYYKYMLDNPQEQTDAMRFGSLFHDLMASCAEHNRGFVEALKAWSKKLAFFIPPLNTKGKPFGATSNAYKEAYDKFLQANEGNTIISEADYELVTSMVLSLLNNCGATSEQVYKLLKWGKPEVSHFFEYEGCKFKFRTDLETRKKIIDYKTVATEDLSERSINNIIAKCGYDISAAFYLWGEHEQSGIWKTFYWLFVSKVPPYDAVLVDASEWTYKYDPDSDIVMPQVGAIKMKRLLDLHIKCTKENDYPGAEINIPEDDFGRRIMLPTPPPWEINLASSILEQTF